ncbi:MAG: hypothetical protein CFE32_23825 [Alphaproteobacteria bacterium PA3]|nr:MAG: hypothetical protein CFE32_23825 [Alphaproteobacteria bacterium PA3]
MKVQVNSIRAGNVLEYNGKLWVASKVQHISPGKGGAFEIERRCASPSADIPHDAAALAAIGPMGKFRGAQHG